MHYWITTLLAVTCLSCFAHGQGETQLSDSAKLRNLGHEERQKQIKAMSADRREQLIDEIKQRPVNPADPRAFDSTLLHLGDAEKIQEYLEAAWGQREEPRDPLFLLRTTHDPRVIAGLGPILLWKFKFHQGFEEPYPWTASWIMREILENTPGFTGEVYEWNRKMRQGHPVETFPMMQRWWQANEAHFKAGNYLAVQPGEVPLPAREWADKYHAEVKPDGTLEVRPQVPMKATPPPSSSPSPPPVPATTAPPTAPNPSQTQRTKFPSVAIVCAVVLLFAAALYLSTRRRK